MSQLVGDYALGALLGRGGASAVYAARHRTTGAEVALKLLHVGDDAALAEAEAPRAIDHPAVVRVLDAGTDAATGRGYVVMEKVDGESLAERLRRGPLSEAAVRRLGAAIADGMAAAHARGVVHRDLKPANVMLAGDAPRIVDFGIAKQLGDRAGSATVRRIGTPAYMAPEQFAGGLITPAVDVWALGVVLFEAATGMLPFVGWDDGRCPPLIDAPARCGPEVSAGFDAIVQRCLARAPGQRFASMAALAAALRDEVEDRERVTEDAGPVAAPTAIVDAHPTIVDARPPIADAPITHAPIAHAAIAPAPTSPRRRWSEIILVFGGMLAMGAFLIAQRCGDSPRRSAAAPLALEADAGPTTVEAPPIDAATPDATIDLEAIEAEIQLDPAPPTDARPATRPPRRDRPRRDTPPPPPRPPREGLD
jgi:hypothetical protein